MDCPLPRGFVKRIAEFGVKWPKVVSKITDDQEALLTSTTFGRSLAASEEYQPHRVHFSAVRARANPTKEAGSREGNLTIVYQLMEDAEGRWRKLTGSRLVALVRAGARFVNGELIEGGEQKNEEKDAA